MLSKHIEQIADRSSMEILFDRVYTAPGKRPPLKVLILFTEQKPEDLQYMVSSRSKLFKKYHLKLSSISPDLHLLHIRRIIGRSIVTGAALLDTGYEGVWVLLTNEGSYFVAHVLERLFEGLYPEFSRLYMNYSQSDKLLGLIEREYNGTKTVEFFSARRERRELQKYARAHEKGTFVLWEARGEEELLTQMKQYRVAVDKLSFSIRDAKGSVLLRAFISRNGLFKLKFGSFRSFYENVVRNAIEMGSGLKRFYSKRQRIEKDGDILLSPLQISYDFSFDKELLMTLASQISARYSTSLIHSGNPYFVANICDYQDGSSFGVTALGNVVTVTPISRATSSAVWKLTNVIQELLGDGRVSSTVSR